MQVMINSQKSFKSIVELYRNIIPKSITIIDTLCLFIFMT